MNYNQMTVTAKMKRIEICDLMLACTAIYEDTESQKWKDLHDKLENILEAFDIKNGIGVF